MLNLLLYVNFFHSSVMLSPTNPIQSRLFLYIYLSCLPWSFDFTQEYKAIYMFILGLFHCSLNLGVGIVLLYPPLFLFCVVSWTKEFRSLVIV